MKVEDIVAAHRIAYLLEEVSKLMDGRPDMSSHSLELNEFKKGFAKKWMLPNKDRLEKSAQEIKEGKFIAL